MSAQRPAAPPAPLSPEEERVIVRKGAERPFSGVWLDNKAKGVYLCRRCGQPLYRSGDKFDSGCGWPSFDASIPGAAQRLPDADGRRVEIVCAACGAHLGHVFEGEGFTAANTRHCVNSLSLSFAPEGGAPAYAYFAGGCFWGVEDAFSKVNGVLDAVSGYMGGSAVRPSYEEVCSGRTGHAETVRVAYDPAKASYESLARLFFEIHDPGQTNRQGPDVGTQYRSAVFVVDEAQKNIVTALMDALRRQGWDVATEVADATVFYPAEERHQDFVARTGRGGCRTRAPRFERGPL